MNDVAIHFTGNISEADALFALQSKLKKNAGIQAAVKSHDIPIYVIKVLTFPDLQARKGIDIVKFLDLKAAKSVIIFSFLSILSKQLPSFSQCTLPCFPLVDWFISAHHKGLKGTDY